MRCQRWLQKLQHHREKALSGAGDGYRSDDTDGGHKSDNTRESRDNNGERALSDTDGGYKRGDTQER